MAVFTASGNEFGRAPRLLFGKCEAFSQWPPTPTKWVGYPELIEPAPRYTGFADSVDLSFVLAVQM